MKNSMLALATETDVELEAKFAAVAPALLRSAPAVWTMRPHR